MVSSWAYAPTDSRGTRHPSQGCLQAPGGEGWLKICATRDDVWEGALGTGQKGCLLRGLNSGPSEYETDVLPAALRNHLTLFSLTPWTHRAVLLSACTWEMGPVGPPWQCNQSLREGQEGPGQSRACAVCLFSLLRGLTMSLLDGNR